MMTGRAGLQLESLCRCGTSARWVWVVDGADALGVVRGFYIKENQYATLFEVQTLDLASEDETETH